LSVALWLLSRIALRARIVAAARHCNKPRREMSDDLMVPGP
jgi:hypothetical protein